MYEVTLIDNEGNRFKIGKYKGINDKDIISCRFHYGDSTVYLPRYLIPDIIYKAIQSLDRRCSDRDSVFTTIAIEDRESSQYHWVYIELIYDEGTLIAKLGDATSKDKIVVIDQEAILEGLKDYARNILHKIWQEAYSGEAEKEQSYEEE